MPRVPPEPPRELALALPLQRTMSAMQVLAAQSRLPEEASTRLHTVQNAASKDNVLRRAHSTSSLSFGHVHHPAAPNSMSMWGGGGGGRAGCSDGQRFASAATSSSTMVSTTVGAPAQRAAPCLKRDLISDISTVWLQPQMRARARAAWPRHSLHTRNLLYPHFAPPRPLALSQAHRTAPTHEVSSRTRARMHALREGREPPVDRRWMDYRDS